jgi:hypothetical protein
VSPLSPPAKNFIRYLGGKKLLPDKLLSVVRKNWNLCNKIWLAYFRFSLKCFHFFSFWILLRYATKDVSEIKLILPTKTKHWLYTIAFEVYISLKFSLFLEPILFVAIWCIFVICVHFMSIWYILCLFGIFYVYLVYFMSIWYILCLFGIFFRFGTSYRAKSGNPGMNSTLVLFVYFFVGGFLMPITAISCAKKVHTPLPKKDYVTVVGCHDKLDHIATSLAG